MSEQSTHSAQPVWHWSDSRDGVSVLFVGSGAGDTAKRLLDSISPAPREVSWLRQVHSNGICTASPGLAGEGDALISGEPGLGVAVATADCVPVLISAGGSVAAVHAGWRGLESGVIRAAVAALEAEYIDLVR